MLGSQSSAKSDGKQIKVCTNLCPIVAVSLVKMLKHLRDCFLKWTTGSFECFDCWMCEKRNTCSLLPDLTMVVRHNFKSIHLFLSRFQNQKKTIVESWGLVKSRSFVCSRWKYVNNVGVSLKWPTDDKKVPMNPSQASWRAQACLLAVIDAACSQRGENQTRWIELCSPAELIFTHMVSLE